MFTTSTKLDLHDSAVCQRVAQVICSQDQPLILSPRLRSAPDELVAAIEYFLSRVGPEWGIVFSLGIIGVTEARLRKAGFRVEEVVNLAYALWCCRAHPNIDVLFTKLQSDHIRGASLEIRIATNLIRHGYHVELDKNLNVKTRSTDVFLQIGTYNWLIECKRPRLNFQRRFDRFNVLQRRLQTLLRGAVAPWLATKELRVDILLQRRINDRESKELVGAVKKLSEEQLSAHIEREGYWSLSIQPQASPPTFDTPFASETTVEKAGHPIRMDSGPIRIYYEPRQGELRLVGVAIHEALTQIRAERDIKEYTAFGLVCIEWGRSDIVMDAASVRLHLQEYACVNAVIGIGNDSTQMENNPRVSAFPQDVAAKMVMPLGH